VTPADAGALSRRCLTTVNKTRSAAILHHLARHRGQLRTWLPETPFLILEHTRALPFVQVIPNPRIWDIRRNIDSNQPGNIQLGFTMHSAQLVSNPLHVINIIKREPNRAVPGRRDEPCATQPPVGIGHCRHQITPRKPASKKRNVVESITPFFRRSPNALYLRGTAVNLDAQQNLDVAW
jgi:hypothetical protein